MNNDRRILSLALEALYAERQKIEAEIETLKGRLRQKSGVTSRPVTDQAKRNRISPAGLKAIAEAQRRRWAKKRLLKAKLRRKQ